MPTPTTKHGHASLTLCRVRLARRPVLNHVALWPPNWNRGFYLLHLACDDQGLPDESQVNPNDLTAVSSPRATFRGGYRNLAIMAVRFRLPVRLQGWRYTDGADLIDLIRRGCRAGCHCTTTRRPLYSSRELYCTVYGGAALTIRLREPRQQSLLCFSLAAQRPGKGGGRQAGLEHLHGHAQRLCECKTWPIRYLAIGLDRRGPC